MVTWTDWEHKGGRWVSRERSVTAFTDARESKALGVRLEEQARRRKLGLVDAATERLATAARQPIADHVDDYMAHLESKGIPPSTSVRRGP
jgi:hypothetical protein